MSEWRSAHSAAGRPIKKRLVRVNSPRVAGRARVATRQLNPRSRVSALAARKAAGRSRAIKWAFQASGESMIMQQKMGATAATSSLRRLAATRAPSKRMHEIASDAESNGLVLASSGWDRTLDSAALIDWLPE